MQPELREAVRKAVASASRPQCNDGALPASVEAVLLPYRGVVFLDDDAGGLQWLTNTITYEHAKLPPESRWAMDYDEEGFGILAPTSGDTDPFLAEDLLTMAVWRTDVGRLYILAESGAMNGRRLTLPRWRQSTWRV